MIKVFTLVAKLRTYAKVAEVLAMANGHNKNSAVDLLNEAADALDELYLQLTKQWTPCSEQLPKHSGWYITSAVIRRDEEGQPCAYKVNMQWYNNSKNAFHDQQPDAWMPIPEVYKE